MTLSLAKIQAKSNYYWNKYEIWLHSSLAITYGIKISIQGVIKLN